MSSPAWLTYPLSLHSSRAFDCEGFTPEQCGYYMYRWRFWYQSDHVFALPTIALFMVIIGAFAIGHVSTQVLGICGKTSPTTLRRSIAISRYLSYRGFRSHFLDWNSAPIGILMLAGVAVVFFFCKRLFQSIFAR